MWTNITYILITALRDRLFSGLMIGVIAAVGISSILGSTAMLEVEQMTLSFAAGSSRMVVIVGLIVFACFHVRHAFDSREIDVFLSRPISRPNLVISYWLGFCVVAALMVVPTLAIVGLLGVLHMEGFIFWSLSFFLETLLVLAIALFAAFTLKSAVASVMASLGFYVLSRMMGFFLNTSDSQLLFKNEIVNAILQYGIQLVSAVIPRLDFFAKTEWLVYGVSGLGEVQWFVLQAVIFIPLLLLAAIIDFMRKEF